MNFKSLVSSLFLAATMIAIVFAAGSANAGRMKDVHSQHMEALAKHLFGNANTDVLETRNTKFTPAEAGFFVAVSSEVSLYSWRHDTFKWIPCTTQFKKLANDDVVVEKVSCEAFD